MHTESQSHNTPSDPLRPNDPSHPSPKRDSENPGYETQDVNVGGILVFLGGLAGSLIVFFLLCFFLGKQINNGLIAADGPTDKWHEDHSLMGAERHGQPRQDLTSNPVMQQRELAQVAASFPLPRVPTDDDNQETADLHAREDLMLNYYTSSPDLGGGKIRIPISQAMALIAQQGLGGATAQAGAATPGAPQRVAMYGDRRDAVSMPITVGFARTGYEQQQMETRAQRLEVENSEGIGPQPMVPTGSGASNQGQH